MLSYIYKHRITLHNEVLIFKLLFRCPESWNVEQALLGEKKWLRHLGSEPPSTILVNFYIYHKLQFYIQYCLGGEFLAKKYINYL